MVGFPNTPMGFPTKNDHFGVFGGYHHLRKHPYQLYRQLDYILCGDLCMVRRYTGTPQKHMFFYCFF